jgi:hypothetical protein
LEAGAVPGGEEFFGVGFVALSTEGLGHAEVCMVRIVSGIMGRELGVTG